MNPVNEDLAYIAGVLDSDGYIGLVRHVDRRRENKPEYYRPTIRVLQTRREAILLIQKVLGGHIYEHEAPKGKNHKKKYDLAIYGYKEVNVALKRVLPYLRIKYMQAGKVIEFTDMRIRKLSMKRSSKNTYQTEEKRLWKEVLALNKVGRLCPIV